MSDKTFSIPTGLVGLLLILLGILLDVYALANSVRAAARVTDNQVQGSVILILIASGTLISILGIHKSSGRRAGICGIAMVLLMLALGITVKMITVRYRDPPFGPFEARSSYP